MTFTKNRSSYVLALTFMWEEWIEGEGGGSGVGLSTTRADFLKIVEQRGG